MRPSSIRRSRGLSRRIAATVIVMGGLCGASVGTAQINVTTTQNDIARTGQNLLETTLTPTNVNAAQFGLLFTQAVAGPVYAQPLYLSNVTINGAKRNVVYVATLFGAVYAFDANSNSGATAKPLWQISLLDAAHGAAPGAKTYGTMGTTSTPVIDPVRNILYVVSTSFEGGGAIFRLHALDVTTGAEALGGPVMISPSAPGSASDAVNGIVSLTPPDHKQRAGLLLLNGIVYVGFSSNSEGKIAQWHGWIVAYDATTLAQVGVFCATPNGTGAGVWMSGGGLAAEQPDPVNHPYGRLFVATGNGDYTAAPPYGGNMDYGDSVLNLDLTGGMPTVTDAFAPYNQARLSKNDLDQGSGGVLILPTQTTGNYPNLLVQTGKSGTLYLLNRDDLGGFDPSADHVVQSMPFAVGALGPETNGGVWSSPSYWNGNVYYWGVYDHLKQFPLVNGLLSRFPIQSTEVATYPSSTSSISANGNAQGIIWTILTNSASPGSPAILEAHDASNVATTLYSSATVPDRDTAGPAAQFAVPTIANGMVYVGTSGQLNVYGLLNPDTQTSRPIITPGTSSYIGSLTATITAATPNATIFYTTDGTPATTSSTPYTGPITIKGNSTLNAVAIAPGLALSNQSSAKYTRTVAATPTFTPPALAYPAAQSVTITDQTPGAIIHYTTDGTKPTPTSPVYSAPISVSASSTISAIATAPGYANSSPAYATYTIADGSTIPVNYATGFPSLAGLQSVGTSSVANNALQLSDGGGGVQVNSTWSTVPVNVTSFTTDFDFQVTTANSYGFTFTLQNSPAGLSALGSGGGGLGYQGIPLSVAVKFDLYDTAGQGVNSTGFYVNGAAPTTPSVDLTNSGIALRGPDILHAHLTYNGTTLALTLTDTLTGIRFTTSMIIDIPGTVGGNFAYAGFTASTGAKATTQRILNWTYASTGGAAAATPTFLPAAGTYPPGSVAVTINDVTPGVTIYYTSDGSTPTASSTAYPGGPINIAGNTTLKALAVASGLANSPVATANYQIQSLAPTFTPPAGTFPNAQLVSISATPGATIYYTTNGATPTTSSTVYSSSISVSANATLQAIALATGYAASAVASASYRIAAPAPTFTPPAGTYPNAQSVTITDSANNAVIHYTADGTAPTKSSATYVAPIAVNSNQTVKAIATVYGFANSPAVAATYKISAPTPTFSPAAGTYTGAQSVVVSDTVANATIYYTIDGTTPTTASTVYAAPIVVSGSETLKAIAVASGYQQSRVGAAAYQIQ